MPAYAVSSLHLPNTDRLYHGKPAGHHLHRLRDRTSLLAAALQTADALMIADPSGSRDFYVHRTCPITGLAAYAGPIIPPDTEEPKQVEQAEHRAVRTGVFTEWSLDKQREHCYYGKCDEGGNCYLSGPEVEEGVVGIVVGKYEPDAAGGHVKDPQGYRIAEVSKGVCRFSGESWYCTSSRIFSVRP